MRWLRNKLNKSGQALLILCLIPVMFMTGCEEFSWDGDSSSRKDAVTKIAKNNADAEERGFLGGAVDLFQDCASFLTFGLIPESDTTKGQKENAVLEAQLDDEESNNIINLVLKALPWVGGAILIIIIIVIISNTRKSKHKAQANAAAMSGGVMMNPQSDINLNANDMNMFE